jgi:hypothetical protein
MAKAESDKKKSEAPRQGRVRAAGELVGSAGGPAFRRFGFIQSSIVSRWGEIVGERYAKVSSPESIRFPAGKKSGGLLTLVVQGAHAPLMQHLSPLILERVNRFFGYPAVAKVAFRQGSPLPAAEPANRPQLRPVPKELGDGLREIADPELRACLESLAARIASTAGPPEISPDEPDPMPVVPVSDR